MQCKNFCSLKRGSIKTMTFLLSIKLMVEIPVSKEVIKKTDVKIKRRSEKNKGFTFIFNSKSLARTD